MTVENTRLRRTLALAACAVLAATGEASAASAAMPASRSTGPALQRAEDSSPVIDRQLWDDRITESSGLARSTYKRPLLWTHNDSGDSARVFAVKGDGNTKAVLTLDGAEAVDWEDIASGPGHTVWVADIGDNGWSRDHVTVYRFTEPKHVESGDVATEAYDLEYPGGPRDAEAILVRPGTGRLFVVSKVEDGGAIYRAPKHLSTSSVNKLKRVCSAPDVVTGGTFAPDGRSLVLINYTRAYVYPGIGKAADSVLSKVNNSAQGESVEIGRGGKRLLLGQEGDDSPVYAMTYNAP